MFTISKKFKGKWDNTGLKKDILKKANSEFRYNYISMLMNRKKRITNKNITALKKIGEVLKIKECELFEHVPLYKISEEIISAIKEWEYGRDAICIRLDMTPGTLSNVINTWISTEKNNKHIDKIARLIKYTGQIYDQI